MFKTIVISLAIGILVGVGSTWYVLRQNAAPVAQNGGTVEQENKTKTVKKTKRPDGTVETETVIVDRGTKTVVAPAPLRVWRAAVGASTRYDFKQGTELYKLQVERRLGTSPFWVGAYTETNGQIGITFAAEF